MITAEIRKKYREQLKMVMERDILLRADVAKQTGMQHMTVSRILDEEKDLQWSNATYKVLRAFLLKKKDKPTAEDLI